MRPNREPRSANRALRARNVARALLAAGLSAGAALAACQSPPSESADAAADATFADSLAPAPLDAGEKDAGPGKQAKLAAANFQVSVIDTPAWPESKSGATRLGYLRAGAVVMAYDRPLPNDDCKEGWLALVSGGYVCGKAVTFDLASARVRLAPKQPDLRAGMPYRYGVNLTDDTPLYRRVLANEDRKKYEPWLIPKPPAPETPDEPESKGEPAPVSASGGTGASGAKDEGTAAAEDDPEQPKRHASDALDAGAKDAGPRRLKGLRGRGVLVRKMVRGFYLALDRDFKAANARWWRTTFGFAVPFERIMVQPGVTKHHGAWFEAATLAEASPDAGVYAAMLPRGDSGALSSLLAAADAATLADAVDGGTPFEVREVGFVNTGYGARVELRWDEKEGKAKVVSSAELPRRTAVGLTGARTTVSGVTYAESASGSWVRPGDLLLARPQTPPDLAPGEKWIDVDITRQALVAFEGTRPVFATLISTGRRNPQDKEHDFPTPQGTFHVREKHVTTTMDGDVASDGPYSIEDVPWVMYFEGSYALHGAFWHDQFGNKRSHGCVNMAPDDARTLFAWSEPRLPEAWHGVVATDAHPGTRIVIHEDALPKR